MSTRPNHLCRAPESLPRLSSILAAWSACRGLKLAAPGTGADRGRGAGIASVTVLVPRDSSGKPDDSMLGTHREQTVSVL
jgi:hypothetical protein